MVGAPPPLLVEIHNTVIIFHAVLHATIILTRFLSNFQVRIAIELNMDVSVGHLPVSIPTIVQKTLVDQGCLALALTMAANVCSTTTKRVINRTCSLSKLNTKLT